MNRKSRASVGDFLGFQSPWERFFSSLSLVTPCVRASEVTIALRAGVYPGSEALLSCGCTAFVGTLVNPLGLSLEWEGVGKVT